MEDELQVIDKGNNQYDNINYKKNNKIKTFDSSSLSSSPIPKKISNDGELNNLENFGMSRCNSKEICMKLNELTDLSYHHEYKYENPNNIECDKVKPINNYKNALADLSESLTKMHLAQEKSRNLNDSRSTVNHIRVNNKLETSHKNDNKSIKSSPKPKISKKVANPQIEIPLINYDTILNSSMTPGMVFNIRRISRLKLKDYQSSQKDTIQLSSRNSQSLIPEMILDQTIKFPKNVESAISSPKSNACFLEVNLEQQLRKLSLSNEVSKIKKPKMGSQRLGKIDGKPNKLPETLIAERLHSKRDILNTGSIHLKEECRPHVSSVKKGQLKELTLDEKSISLCLKATTVKNFDADFIKLYTCDTNKSEILSPAKNPKYFSSIRNPKSKLKDHMSIQLNTKFPPIQYISDNNCNQSLCEIKNQESVMPCYEHANGLQQLKTISIDDSLYNIPSKDSSFEGITINTIDSKSPRPHNSINSNETKTDDKMSHQVKKIRSMIKNYKSISKPNDSPINFHRTKGNIIKYKTTRNNMKAQKIKFYENNQSNHSHCYCDGDSKLNTSLITGKQQINIQNNEEQQNNRC